MKFAVAVILALAMAVNARQLTWSPEEMAAMGYSSDPSYVTVAPDDTAADQYYVKPYYGKPYYLEEDPGKADTHYYGKPYYAAPEEDPAEAAYYGKPYYGAVDEDADAVDPYNGYYVKPTVDDYAAEEDPVACFYKKHFSCDAPEEVSPTCGTETCTLPNLCLTVKKTVKKMVEVPVTECADPKLVCKEIKKECGDTECAYNEVCKVDKVCKKGYGYPYPEVDEEEDDEEDPYYPYPYPYPSPEEEEDDSATATATAKAVSTDGGKASANAVANAVANAGSKKLLGAHHGYPGKYPYHEVDDAAEDPAYGAYKVACKDTYSCEEVDPKVCKTVTHEVCVKKDPKDGDPGLYKGYSLGWAPGYQYGQSCGGTVCDAGSFCATCEVEVCKEAVMEKDAAQCGYDAKGVPTFCPAGHMCTELCAPVKKYIAVEVEVPVCVDPTDETYADEVAAAVTECGPHKCLPGYECNSAPVKVCGAYEDPAEEDDEEDKLHGYYFYYDPDASEDDVEDVMPGYHYYPHDAAGDASGCGYYLYYQPDIEVDDEEEKTVPYYYYAAKPAAADPVDPYYYYYYHDPAADDKAAKPYYYSYPYGYKDGADKGGDPYYHYTYPDPSKHYYHEKPDPWVDSSTASTAKVQSVAKSDGDSVYVWGDSKTTGDATGSFDAHASSGDDTYADITGGSGAGDDHKGYANVDCSTAAKDGKVAGCDGSANHN